MLSDAAGRVAVNEQTQALRARLGHGLYRAGQADRATDANGRSEHCREALQIYAELAPQVPGHEGGAIEARREMALLPQPLPPQPRSRPAPKPVVVKPPPTPEQRWRRRDRVLVANLTLSAIFTASGLLIATALPISDAVAARKNPGGLNEGYATLFGSPIGASIAIIAAVPLVVWSVRLKRHRSQGIAVLRGRGRLQVSGPGLRLDF